MSKIYFASPLFNEMEQMYNQHVVDQLRVIRPDWEIYLPQENMAINDKSLYADSLMITQGDNDQLLSSDLLIAVLDGASIDVGVATEIGVAFAKGMKIIGLYTDTRQGHTYTTDKIEALKNEVAENQFHYVNLFTVGCIKQNGMIVSSLAELLKTVKDI